MNRTWRTYLTFLTILISSCSNECYEILLKREATDNSQADLKFFYDNTFVPSAMPIEKMSYYRYCIPDSIKIPSDSKFVVGNIDFLGTKGINVFPGNSGNYFKDGDLVSLVYTDEIIVKIHPTDTALINKVFSIMKDVIIRADSIKNK